MRSGFGAVACEAEAVDESRRGEIEDFLAATRGDRSLLPQLSPDSLQVFNAATSLRPSTRHGCVVTQARPPSLRSTLHVGLSPTGQAVYSLYRALYQLAGGLPESVLPAMEGEQAHRLREAFGELPCAASNDAIVPTQSQVWGDIVHAAWADHLDVIGHFNGPNLDPPHIDWLATQSKFTRPAFENLWRDIARYMVGVDG